MRTQDAKPPTAHRVLDWLFPRRCALCGLLGPEVICRVCFGEFERQETPVEHLGSRGPLEFRAAPYRYHGRAAQAIRRLKYNRSTSLGPPLAHLIKTAYDELSLGEFDAIIPVPIHWMRKFQRGFNQSDLLCAELPSDLVHPSLLRRTRATRPQVGLTVEERLSNLADAFYASPEVRGLAILLIDDVTTSGGTASECAKALREAGAVRVGILTLVSGS